MEKIKTFDDLEFKSEYDSDIEARIECYGLSFEEAKKQSDIEFDEFMEGKTTKQREYYVRIFKEKQDAGLDFWNGYGISVVDYGEHYESIPDAKRHRFEIAVMKDDEVCCDSGITDDVIHCDKSEIDLYMKKIQRLDKVYYRKDGKTVDYTCDADGNEVHYQKGGLAVDEKGQPGSYIEGDGKTVDYTKDKEGNETHYRGDGVTIDYTKDKYGNETHYKEDGVTINYTKDKNGVKIYHMPNGDKIQFDKYGSSVVWKKDKDDNETFYRKGSNTIDYTKDKNGNEIHYLPDGKTVDYKLSAEGVRTDRDDIKDNILARKRRYWARKMGLENVKTHKVVRQMESFISGLVSKEK